MKKFLAVTAFALTLGFAGFAQVLDKPMVQNTLWTGFGNPTGNLFCRRRIYRNGRRIIWFCRKV